MNISQIPDFSKEAQRTPGKFVWSALKQMSDQMGSFGIDMDDPKSLRFQQYLGVILKNRCSQAQMGIRNSRELETLSMVLDHLLSGRVVQALDTLTQRFRAIEHVLATGSWSSAAHLELLKPHEGLLSLNERQVLQKREMLMLKLDDARKKASSRSG